MILTRDYRPVLASFDSPQKFEVETEHIFDESKKDSGYLFYNIDVDPLEYRMDMNGEKGIWDVSFFLSDVRGSREELAEYFSRVFRRTITPSEVPGMKKYLLSNPQGDLNFGNAPEVFSNVLKILQELIDNYTVNCVTLTSATKKKARVYRRMIERYFGDWDVVLDNGMKFQFCRM